MSRRPDPKKVFTLSFVMALLALVVFRSNGFQLGLPSWIANRFSAKAAESPEDSIYSMLDAARAGDIRAYLDSFSGPIHEQIAQVIKENSETKFGEYLKSQNTAFQSVAVSLADRTGESEVQARIEYVYSNRNEVQNVYLRKEASRWRIFKIAGANQIRTLVPFGSSVSD